jgi:hypothetical protein
LRDRGILRYSLGGDVILPAGSNEQLASVDLHVVFNDIELKIERYALEHFDSGLPPVSKSWTEALIGVLKLDTTLKPLTKSRTTTTRTREGTIVTQDPAEIERLIVARFVEYCQSTPDEQTTYEQLVSIYSGIRIEDFIQDIQLFSISDTNYRLNIYYDTSVVLRLLGLSGAAYQATTTKMHTSLVKLGCKAKFLAVTKSEVKRILENIVSDPDHSHPETYDAWTRGEFSIKQIADYPIIFPTLLDKPLGITQAQSANISVSKKWTVTESENIRLVRMLEAESDTWKETSIANDAGAIAEILKLRAGHVTDEIADARHVFLSVKPIITGRCKGFLQIIVRLQVDETIYTASVACWANG